jgi:hypothetical protein
MPNISGVVTWSEGMPITVAQCGPGQLARPEQELWPLAKESTAKGVEDLLFLLLFLVLSQPKADCFSMLPIGAFEIPCVQRTGRPRSRHPFSRRKEHHR